MFFFLYDPCICDHVFSCLKTQHPFEFKKLLGQSVSHSTPAWSSGHLGRGRRQIDFPAVGGPGVDAVPVTWMYSPMGQTGQSD